MTEFIAIINLIFFVTVHFPAGLQAWSNESEMVTALLQGYQKSARPMRNFHGPLKITFSLYLRNIQNLDEQSQILSGNGFLVLSWDDHSLAWNPLKAGGIDMITIPMKEIWTPNINLLNGVGDEEHQTVQIAKEVRVQDYGHVVSVSTETFSTSCKVNLKYFPFDKQSCNIIYFIPVPNTYYQLVLNEQLMNGKTPPHLVFESSTEWENVKTTLKEVNLSLTEIESHSAINVTITMTRQPGFYIMYLLAPSILISYVSAMVFALPPESGERIGLSVTSLLSYTVFLLMVSEVTPKGGENLPILVFYITMMEVLTTVSLIFNIGVLKIFNKHSQEMISKRIQKYLIGNLGRVLGVIEQTSQVEPFHDSDTINARAQVSSQSVKSFSEMKDNKPQDNYTWTDVAKVVDKLCLILCITVVTVASLVMLILITTH